MSSMVPPHFVQSLACVTILIIISSSSVALSATQHSMTTINFTDLDAMAGVANASFSIMNLNDAKTFWWTELSLVNYLPM